jgi:hypothetical protein
VHYLHSWLLLPPQHEPYAGKSAVAPCTHLYTVNSCVCRLPVSLERTHLPGPVSAPNAALECRAHLRIRPRPLLARQAITRWVRCCGELRAKFMHRQSRCDALMQVELQAAPNAPLDTRVAPCQHRLRNAWQEHTPTLAAQLVPLAQLASLARGLTAVQPCMHVLMASTRLLTLCVASTVRQAASVLHELLYRQYAILDGFRWDATQLAKRVQVSFIRFAEGRLMRMW